MRALESFRDGGIRVLVASDIAARGIDIDSITHVVKDGRVYDGNTLDELLPTPRKLDPSQWTKEVPKVTTSVKE